MFGCSTIEQGRILALTCLKKGIDPLSIAERYHIIKGDLSMRSDAMLAGIGQFGGKYRVVRRTADAAEIEITREDDKQRFALTWEEAKAEPFTKAKDGSIKENYATPRTRMQMLWARVVSDGVRTMWPEVVTGYYTPEEIADTNGEAIDASFTVVPETKPATSETKQPAAEPKPVFSGDPGFATHSQVEQIHNLYSLLGIDADTQTEILRKKGVGSLRGLTTQVAAEMLIKLQANAATVARQAEAEIDAAPVVDPAQGQSMEIDGPCTANQVATIKTIATEIEQLQPGITAKVRVKILEAGLQKLADLSCREADMLIQALRLKNLEAFFAAKIEGFAPRDIVPSDEQKNNEFVESVPF
jgi:hypothetical protein